MFISSKDYLQEIASSLKNADYSLASRRMLDFLYDFDLNSNIAVKSLSFEIRQTYKYSKYI